jgi:DNA polymerase-3 subunit alpha
MDGLGQREALLDSKRLDSAIAAAQIDQKAASTGQGSLFDMLGGAALAPKPILAAVPTTESAGPPSKDRSLWEKEVLGFQFGDHPFMEAAAWLANALSHDMSQVTSELSGERVKIAGLVTGVRRILTKTKSQMAVLMLEDLHGTIEAVVFPRVYERSPELWREDAILVVEGRVDTRSDRPQLVVDRAEEWTAPPKGAVRPAPPTDPRAVSPAQTPRANGPVPSAAPGRAVEPPRPPTNGTPARPQKRVLKVVVERGEDDNACVRVLEQLHGLVERFPGSDEIQLVLHDRSGGRVELAGTDILVRHTPDLETQVRTLVGADNLVVVSSAAE